MHVFNIDAVEQISGTRISVNVFELEVWQESGALRPYKGKPIRLTRIKAETHINPLLTIEGDNMHYVPITDFNRLMFKQQSKRDHRAYFCQFCCHGLFQAGLAYKASGDRLSGNGGEHL